MSETAPRVSVVIPVYNTEAYLWRCIHSVIAQTWRNIEVIIVNDCSPGDADSIIQDAGKQDARVRYVKNDKNLGLGMSRDRGIVSATGKYIMFVDSDDFIHHTTVEHCVKWIERHDSDIVEFGFRYYREGDAIDLDRHSTEYRIEYLQVHNRAGDDVVALGRKIDDVCWNKLFRTDLIRTLKLEFRERYYEDTAFTRAYVLNTKQAVIVSLPLYYYYVNPCSITRALSTEKVIAAVNGSCRVLDVLHKYGAPCRMREEFLRTARGFILRLLLSLPVDERREVCTYIEGKDSLLKEKMRKVTAVVRDNQRVLFAYLCIVILGPTFWIRSAVRSLCGRV